VRSLLAQIHESLSVRLPYFFKNILSRESSCCGRYERLRHAADLAPQTDNPRYYIMRQSGCVRSEPRRENGKWWRHPWNAEQQQLHSTRSLVSLCSSVPTQPSCNCLRWPFPLTIVACVLVNFLACSPWQIEDWWTGTVKTCIQQILNGTEHFPCREGFR